MIVPVALVLLVAGCAPGVGYVDVPDDSGGTAATDSTADTASTETCDPTALAPTPLRRLTPTQYRAAVTDLFPGVTLPTASLPDDPEVDGFDNDGDAQQPSALLVAAYQEAAIDVAEAVVTDGTRLGCPSDGGDDPVGCGEVFLLATATHGFRRPLDDTQRATWSAYFEERLAEEGFAVALTLSVEAVLQSPDFLYLPEYRGPTEGARAPLDGYELATRLSFFLWGSLPDDTLLAAAGAGDLTTADGVEAQARRMLADPRAEAGIGDFHRLWLDLDDIDAISPDESVYVDFRNSMPAAMREEIDRLVTRVVLEEDGTLAELLTTPDTEVDDDLALLYGLDDDASDWHPVTLDPAQRAGVLTTPGWLAATSHEVDPSPVQRGVFVLTRLFCLPPGTPPAGVTTVPTEGDTGGEPTTNRERYAAHTADPDCSGCHVAIDGIGFGFEHYDAVGAWRDTDGGLPVDASGGVVGTDVDGPFVGAPELMGRLAESASVRRCVAGLWTRFALGRALDDADTCAADDLAEGFVDDDRIAELLVAIVRSDLFRYRGIG